MASPQDVGIDLNDELRTLWPGHPGKRLARAMGVPVGTAREWLYRRFSTSRRQELARALLAEMDEQEVSRAALRRRLVEWSKGET